MLSFSSIQTDNSWAFADKTRKDTAYATHGYHSYPAKFIPQIVCRVADKYTKKTDLVVDPFGGCGTTLVESKIMGRNSVGVDINPVAVMIANAKTTAIEPSTLLFFFEGIMNDLKKISKDEHILAPAHERIDYWFKAEQKQKLTILFHRIEKINDANIKNFFTCAFSNILKKCSIWMQKSNKPTRDFNKIPADPFIAFEKQVKMMMRGNEQFFQLVSAKKGDKPSAKIFCRDARDVPIANNTASLVVTSPPYVTSYEYADLHQLTALWLEYTNNLTEFRKRFIGTAYYDKPSNDLNSGRAKKIVDELMAIDKRTSFEVGKYFSDMNQVFIEMNRYLQKGGIGAIVIGNTKLKGVDIANAEVFHEQLANIGFKEKEVIKREIPSKNLPSIRDSLTGKFAKASSKNKVFIYPTEYILVMEKK